MGQTGLAEEQVYTLLKKTSMDVRKPMADIAEAVILAGGFWKKIRIPIQAAKSLGIT